MSNKVITLQYEFGPGDDQGRIPLIIEGEYAGFLMQSRDGERGHKTWHAYSCPGGRNDPNEVEIGSFGGPGSKVKAITRLCQFVWALRFLHTCAAEVLP